MWMSTSCLLFLDTWQILYWLTVTSLTWEFTFWWRVTSHCASTFSRRDLPDLLVRHTLLKSIKTTSICTWPTIPSTRRMTNSSRTRTVNRMTSVTSGRSAPSAVISSKSALTWIYSGRGSTMSRSKRSCPQRTTSKMPWRRMVRTGPTASRYSVSISSLTPIWSLGSSRRTWVHRWPVTRRSIWPLSPTSSATVSTSSALKDLTEEKNRWTRSSTEWKAFTIKARRQT